MAETSEHILKQHDIRQTDCRLDILAQFLRRETAMSQPDLEKQFGGVYDRVTIYRTLQIFLEKGILHRVLDDEGAMKYALCHDDHCTTDEHHHEHVHFKCVECGQTHCLEDLEVPRYKLPKGFQLIESNLLLQGVCEKCGEAKAGIPEKENQ